MFKSVENINVNRVHFTIHHYNNRKPYCHFRGGNHHNEEHKYLGRGIIKHLGKCNKQQVKIIMAFLRIKVPMIPMQKSAKLRKI